MQARMRDLLRWIRDKRGVTSIEYALLAAMFAVAVLGSVVTLRGALVGVYSTVATAVTAAVSAAVSLAS
ncbi:MULTISPECIES: Flp family type IVb pilin [Burkholderia]|uniref:Flp family type IVb pilin n=1 Tax=Burkholderia TaxID=32008 RepID=UPI000BF87836|nr:MULTISPECIES: Flp family type IVb pilin [Burkholderia]PFH20346.1 Flp pilus assembly pilin Flp [Burkholderia sp. JKS000303]